MMIHFRRNALRVTVAALLSSAFGAQAADIPQVKVTVNDKLPSIGTERYFHSGL